MFGKQQDPSRTEQATPKRVKKQRDEGNVPKSQELAKVTSLIGGLIGLYVWIGQMREESFLLLRRFLGTSHTFVPTQDNLYVLAMDVALSICKMVLPILLFLAVLTFLIQRIQVGRLWTTKVFKFRWQRFNILKGIKQMMASPQTIMRTIKSLLFCIVLSVIPGYIIYGQYQTFLTLFFASPEGVATYMLQGGLRLAAFSMMPLMAIAAFDVWQSRYAYNEGIKMTKDEVKDERKQAEGDPVIKNQQRKKMMQVAMKRMLQEVPKADVVITNPTHIAVALRYNPSEAPAPVVLAKGADHLAEKIKEVAREHDVPIRENVPLARALYKSVDIGGMIPVELYKAVATILSSIMKFRQRATAR